MKTALALLTFLLLTTTAHASVLITSVEVDVGSSVWCNVGNASPACAGALTPWNLGGGILLNPGDSLVLTQTGGLYNFDTSDACPASGGGCTAPRVTVNGVSFSDVAKILAGQGASLVDPVTPAFNEAHDWLGLGAAGGFALSVGYADNLHTNACADADGNCLPENPFANATHFLGAGSGVVPAGFTDVGGHCSFRASDCFDAGALLLRVVVPEPATWMLMSLGLLVAGLALRRRQI